MRGRNSGICGTELAGTRCIASWTHFGTTHNPCPGICWCPPLAWWRIQDPAHPDAVWRLMSVAADDDITSHKPIEVFFHLVLGVGVVNSFHQEFHVPLLLGLVGVTGDFLCHHHIPDQFVIRSRRSLDGHSLASHHEFHFWRLFSLHVRLFSQSVLEDFHGHFSDNNRRVVSTN